VSVTWLGLSSLPARLGTSAVVVIGVAMVVAVFVSVFAMAVGFESVMANAGHTDRLVILGGNGDSESASDIPRESVQLIADVEGIRRTPDGRPLISGEALAFVPLTDRATGLDAAVTLRGVGPLGVQMRPEIHLVAGRMFRPGAHELIVGAALRHRMVGADIGNTIELPDGDWQITGVFESGADVHESELLSDSETLLNAYKRQSFNSVAVVLESPAAFARVKDAIASNRRLPVTVLREDTYIEQSSSIIRNLLRAISFGIGGIMAFGAAFGAVNTMYSSVSVRAAEIATLRAMGFNPTAVIASVLIESLCLALAGAVIGTALAWILVNGTAVSTLTESGESRVTFALDLNVRVVVLGVLAACLIGLIGGLLPAVRAGTQPIAEAFRKA
jgi:putative ABC transport system permease protein